MVCAELCFCVWCACPVPKSVARDSRIPDSRIPAPGSQILGSQTLGSQIIGAQLQVSALFGPNLEARDSRIPDSSGRILLVDLYGPNSGPIFLDLSKFCKRPQTTTTRTKGVQQLRHVFRYCYQLHMLLSIVVSTDDIDSCHIKANLLTPWTAQNMFRRLVQTSS